MRGVRAFGAKQSSLNALSVDVAGERRGVDVLVRAIRLPAKNLTDPPPIVDRPCQTDRLRRIRSGQLCVVPEDAAPRCEGPREQCRVADVASDRQRLFGLIETPRADPADDLLSDMMRAEVDDDRLTHEELLALAAQLLMGGTDTTRNQLAAAVQVFCAHPDQWRLLAERPELAVQAVHEVMRYCPVILTTMRVPIEDVELAGVRIPAGTLIIANTVAANRDPAVYPEPDRFDIAREDAPAMLTFGGGIHHCLGAHLAHIELVEGLTTMARRMPGVRRAGPVSWTPMTGITGPISLPVEFTTRP